MESDYHKNVEYASKFYQLANDQMEKHNFTSALDYYTLALIYTPSSQKKNVAGSNCLKEGK